MDDFVKSFDNFLFEKENYLESNYNKFTSLPKIGKVFKVPYIIPFIRNKNTFYGIKYILPNGNSFRITSLNHSFKEIISIDLFTATNLDPIIVLTNLKKIKSPKDLGDILNLSFNSKDFKSKEHPLIKESTMDKLEKFNFIVGVILPLVSLTIILGSYGVKAYKTYKEKQVYFNSQLNKDEAFFKNTVDDQNDFKVYATLYNLVDVLINTKRTSLLINGRPGTGKTFTVKRRLFQNNKIEGKDYILIKGSTDLEGLYESLFDYRKKLIIFDDCDSLFDSDDFVNIMKAVTDSSPRRLVSLRTGTQITPGGSELGSELKTPKIFDFTGKIIIITNLPTSDIPPAIISRTGAYTVKISDNDMLKRIKRIMVDIRPNVDIKYKEEVLNYLIEIHKKHPNMNFDLRIFSYAIDDRMSGIKDWKSMVKSRVILSKSL